MGRGYSFEVIRARILYAPENAKTTTLRRGILRDQQAYYTLFRIAAFLFS